MKSIMFSQNCFINKDLRSYLLDLLGEKLYRTYINNISSPMEEYTLHVYRDISSNSHLLDLFEENGFTAKIHPLFSNVIITKPKGPFTVNKSPDLKDIIVDNRAAEMIYQGADIYVPGVKRANKVREGDIVNVLNQNNVFVAQAKALLNHSDILSKKHGIAAKSIISPYVVPHLSQLNVEQVEKIRAYFQSIPAYLAAVNLEPKPEDKILDCCAAPGNKTVHLSELTKEKAKIIAVDRSKNRIQKINKKISRFKIKNISTILGNIIDLSKKWKRKFDKILIDPPCSSLGLRPRLNIKINPKVFFDNSRYQKAIFFACDKLLKDKGTVIYSTCTITKKENENVIDYALNKLNYRLLEQSYRLSDYKLVKNPEFSNVQRFIPGKHKTLGYFIAKLQKK